MLFVGPTPAAIMQVQRDLLVQDVVHMMERHFDGSELDGVVAEIDKLFGQRFDELVSSLETGQAAAWLWRFAVAQAATAAAADRATCIRLTAR
jgi:hypothetical protein